jgi:ATP-dependent RNA helicase DDX24/MAK5
VVSRLKPRATLAKKIADVGISKEKGYVEDKWLREAAEELGVDYDSEEMENMAGGKKGRGSGRRKKERDEREIGREDLGALKAELKALLAQRVNLGISERYLASGVVDVDALLRGDMGDFLGAVNPLDLET